MKTAFLYPIPALLFLISWQLYSGSDKQRQFFFSSPVLVWDAFVRLVTSGELLNNSMVTIGEALAGFVLGTVCGALIGLVLWYFPIIARVSKPYIGGLASVPIFALAPIIIVWFGIGTLSKIMLAFLSTVAVAIVQSYSGAIKVDPKYLRFMQIVGATRWQLFKTVIFPSSLTWVINAMKLNIGLAILGAFIGEFISAERGLGYMIVRASGVYDMATVFVGVFTLMAIALTGTALVDRLERRLLRWQSLI